MDMDGKQEMTYYFRKLLFILALVALGLSHWLRVISGQIEPVDSMYLLAAFSSAAIWPALFSLLRSLRRGFIKN